MKNLTATFKALLLGLAALAIYSCSTQRNTASTRALQNLSARYNLIYNSNVLLDEYEMGLQEQSKLDYDYFLPVYFAPAVNYGDNAPVKALDDIDGRARTIVAEKNFSNYLDEAYILMGKTNFYRGNFFNAFEYFDYISHAYAQKREVYITAQNWKARCMMKLDEQKRVSQILDTLNDTLSVAKKPLDGPLATMAQQAINMKDYPSAIKHLLGATAHANKSFNKIRWNYILGQLYEQTEDYGNSLKYYQKVEKSTAPFEMYFNAKLSHIRVEDALTNGKMDRRQQLAKLLKDDKNADFVDQIYYEMAQDYYADSEYEKAIGLYKKSVQESTVNTTQKGLSYLRIADVNFKDLNNYVAAKLYYDSAVATLPKTYPNYASIQKKADNLQYLTERYEKITLEDTLQYVASLPETERKGALEKFFAPKAVPSTDVAGNKKGNITKSAFIGVGNGTFYFANATAMSRGLIDFQKKWGDRKLEDNWRQSTKSFVDNSTATNNNVLQNGDLPINPDLQTVANSDTLNADIAVKYLDSLPLTADKKLKSDQKIITAYIDIASFYQQELNDKPEAIKTYELLLKRFPSNNYLDIVYYSLYLSYKGVDQSKSDYYKNLVLTQFSSSVYAKTILDPNYSLKQSALEQAVLADYNHTFDAFLKKDFPSVITSAGAAVQRFPGNELEPQFAYLKSIGVGRTQPVDPLIASFKDIVEKYPNDVLIKPLVEQHLAYIQAHYADFKRRKVALLDFDPNEPRFNFVANQADAEENRKELDEYNQKQEKALRAKRIADSLKNILDNEKLSKADAKRKADELKKANELKKAAELAQKKSADSLAKVFADEKKAALEKHRLDSLEDLAIQKKKAMADQKRLDSITDLQKKAKDAKTADSLAKAFEAEKLAMQAKRTADSLDYVEQQKLKAQRAKATLDSIAKVQADLAQKRTADSLAIAKEAKRLADEKFKADSIAKIREADKIWTTEQGSLYYAVIAVNRTDISVSSSRFGVGQFNRGNYSGNNLRHNLKELADDQLIYIGDFSTLAEAKAYEMEISKQLSSIMKVPATNYTTFVVSKENLNKITDRLTLSRYQNFLQRNEQ